MTEREREDENHASILVFIFLPEHVERGEGMCYETNTCRTHRLVIREVVVMNAQLISE